MEIEEFLKNAYDYYKKEKKSFYELCKKMYLGSEKIESDYDNYGKVCEKNNMLAIYLANNIPLLEDFLNYRIELLKKYAEEDDKGKNENKINKYEEKRLFFNFFIRLLDIINVDYCYMLEKINIVIKEVFQKNALQIIIKEKKHFDVANTLNYQNLFENRINLEIRDILNNQRLNEKNMIDENFLKQIFNEDKCINTLSEILYSILVNCACYLNYYENNELDIIEQNNICQNIFILKCKIAAFKKIIREYNINYGFDEEVNTIISLFNVCDKIKNYIYNIINESDNILFKYIDSDDNKKKLN